jgi:hypothetical protein
MSLPAWHTANFDTLMLAAASGALALVEALDRSTNEKVALLCAVAEDDGEFAITPFAQMVEGNPFTRYAPPDPQGGFFTS